MLTDMQYQEIRDAAYTAALGALTHGHGSYRWYRSEILAMQAAYRVARLYGVQRMDGVTAAITSGHDAAVDTYADRLAYQPE